MYYLSHGTIYRIIHEELGMKKVGARWVAHFLTGAHKWRVKCSKQMLAMFEPQGPKRLTDVVRGERNFHQRMWHALKTGKCCVDRWSLEQISCPQTWISKQEAALHCIFNHAGPLVVGILPEKTTMTSPHYTGTVLPTVVVAVHEQWPNVGYMLLLFHGV